MISRQTLRRHRFRFILGLLAGIALLFVVAKFINLTKTWHEFSEYSWHTLPAILALSLGYYLVKALRWQYFLRAIDIKLPLRRSVLVYLAGQWFAFTPAGEFVRAYLLTGYGFSFSRGSAAVTVQVVFDLLSLAIVGSIAVLRYSQLSMLVQPFTVAMVVGIIAFVYWPLLRRGPSSALVPGAVTAPVGRRFANFYAYSRQLLAWKPLLIGLALGIISVIMGVLVLLEVSRNHEIEVGFTQSAYIYSLSQLAGALSMLPHGLGAIEGSSVGLFHNAGVDTAHAASAIVLFRLATLGWSVVLGGVSLVLLRTPLAGPVPPSPQKPVE